MGQSASAFLAVHYPLCYGVAWRESFFFGPGRVLRRGLASGGNRLCDPATADHQVAGREARHSQAGDWRRLEGEVVGADVRRRNRSGVLAAANFPDALWTDGDDLVYSGS